MGSPDIRAGLKIGILLLGDCNAYRCRWECSMYVCVYVRERKKWPIIHQGYRKRES